MMWFTADLHLDHNNMIIYEARPVYYHEFMAYLWNKDVKNDDEIWVIGDFIWRNHNYWLSRLKGKIHLVRGNHDHRRTRYERHGLEVRTGPVFLELPQLGRVKLTHHPDHTCRLINLCGHVHGWWKRMGNCINVGVDVWNFHLVNEEMILKFMEENGVG